MIKEILKMKASSMMKKDLNIDDVDDITDDLADLMYDMDEINEALGQNFSTPEDIDEADLEAELDMLDDELDDELLDDEAPAYLQESEDLPAQPTAPGAPWLMFPGTAGAHIMITPPSQSTGN